EHSWYLPKWLQRVLPKIDIEGHELQYTNLTRKESTVDEDAFVNGEESSTLSAPENMDDRTIQLYNDLLGDAANHTSLFNSLLFNALMQYAKDNNQQIYQQYLAESGDQECQTPNLNQGAQKELTDSEIKKLVEQQNLNMEKINDILSKLVYKDKDET